ncbi:MAG: hypothetical protein ACYCXW_02170 [Solirubrobacteraceae bacterium]
MATLQADIATQARQLLKGGYELHLASNHDVLAHLDLSPLGIPLAPWDFLAATDVHWTVADLMRVYSVLNAVSFDVKGIPIPTWVMIDLGLLPSAFLLVTLPREHAARVAADARAVGHPAGLRTATILDAVLAESDRLHYEGPVPVAGYCAAPTPDPSAWVGWSLCSAIPGLGTLAKGLALTAYRARTLTGVAQFSDHGLRVHRKFGRMEILRATCTRSCTPSSTARPCSMTARTPSRPSGWTCTTSTRSTRSKPGLTRAPAASSFCPQAWSMTGSRSWSATECRDETSCSPSRAGLTPPTASPCSSTAASASRP